MRILVASSGNPDEPVDPVNAAAAFPWPPGSEIHVLSVAESIRPVMVGVGPDALDASAATQVRSKADAKSVVAGAAAQLRGLGFRAEGLAMEGVPEAVITSHAKDWNADLIVVGSHDSSLLEKLLLGSVSQGVLKHAPCSVLVVKQRVQS